MSKEKALPALNRIQAARAPRFLLEEEQPQVAVAPEVPVVSEAPQTPWQDCVERWLTTYKWGQRFAAAGEFLSEETLNRVSEMIRAKAYEFGGDGAVNEPDYLESAYISLLDAGDLDSVLAEAEYNQTHPPVEVGDGFFGEKRVLRDLTPEQLAAQQAAFAECQRIEDARLAEEAANAHRALRSLGGTRDGLRELRRKAIPILQENRVGEVKGKLFLG